MSIHGNSKLEKMHTPSILSTDSELLDSDDEDPVPQLPRLRKKWRSALLDPNEPYEKPWLGEKQPKAMWERIIFYFGCFCGAVIGVWLCVTAFLKNAQPDVC